MIPHQKDFSPFFVWKGSSLIIFEGLLVCRLRRRRLPRKCEKNERRGISTTHRRLTSARIKLVYSSAAAATCTQILSPVAYLTRTHTHTQAHTHTTHTHSSSHTLKLTCTHTHLLIFPKTVCACTFVSVCRSVRVSASFHVLFCKSVSL